MEQSSNNKEKEPLVSIIMPAYNAERFIGQAIESVIAQTLTDWELIVIDDGSSDSTRSIVETFAADDVRVTLVCNEQNMGVARTRNRGFDLSRGKYVALLDSDDVWYPEKLQRQIELASESGADIIYCSYEMIDEAGTKICEDFIVPDRTDFDAFLPKSVISCSTALLSNKITDNYRFSVDFYHEDLALWLQLLKDGYKARGLTDVLARYRIMDGTRASNKLFSAVRRWVIYRKYLRLPLSKSVAAIVRYALLGFKKYRRRKE